MRDYGYVTPTMWDLPFVISPRLSNMAFYPSMAVNVYGVSENFLHFTYNKYFLYKELDTRSPGIEYEYVDGKPDVFRSLYVDAGRAVVDSDRPGFHPSKIYSGYRLGTNASSDIFDEAQAYRDYVDVVVSEAMIPAVSASMYQPMQLRMQSIDRKNPERKGGLDFVCKARAFAYKVPSFHISRHTKLSASKSAVIMSMDAYAKVARKLSQTVGLDYNPKLVHKNKLLVKLGANITTVRQREEIINGLRSLVDSDFTLMEDVQDIKESTKTATTVLLGFFDVVAAIAVLLCFLMLTLSFAANVRDNSWEFGVLRSIGLSVNALVRAYIYEALVLVIAAFTCGTVIGIAIAITLTMQFNLFLQMPFNFEFPYWLFFSMGAMAMIVAVLGFIFPRTCAP